MNAIRDWDTELATAAKVSITLRATAKFATIALSPPDANAMTTIRVTNAANEQATHARNP